MDIAVIEEIPPKINLLPSLKNILESFDGILLDAYGVFWGGGSVGLLPGSKKAMEEMVAKGKIVGILSNSTQSSQFEIEKLKRCGLLESQHFHFFITSGDVARNIFLNSNSLPFPVRTKKFSVFGAPHPKFSPHRAIFEGTEFQETKDLKESDFIYISIPHIEGEDQMNPHVFLNSVSAFKGIEIPMVCANPDRFAHEGNPPRPVVRQGSIAMMHEQQGGRVFYIGKPSIKMYSAAMERFLQKGIVDKQKILMVGDTPETDIRGARNFGIASALITKTGILADRIANRSDALDSLPLHDRPHFFIERLGIE